MHFDLQYLQIISFNAFVVFLNDRKKDYSAKKCEVKEIIIHVFTSAMKVKK